jgi:hypothetical protein
MTRTKKAEFLMSFLTLRNVTQQPNRKGPVRPGLRLFRALSTLRAVRANELANIRGNSLCAGRP